MSILKYYESLNGKTDETRGLPLYFDQVDNLGMPFRGPAFLMKDAEWDRYTFTSYDFFSETFDLSDPAQRQKYQEIVDRCINGWYIILYRHFNHSEHSNYPSVYLEWIVPYRELNPTKKNLLMSQPHVFSKE